MLKKSYSPTSLNNKGMAVLEIIPIITVIVLLLNFSIGFFGSIHTGILQSISSRNYAFETFSNRSDLIYFRNTITSSSDLISYQESGMRIHGTKTEDDNSIRFTASTRNIAFFEKKNAAEIEGNDGNSHIETSNLASGRNEKLSVNPIWIKTTYGICLNSECKGIN